MTQQLLRVYQELDMADIREHLLICGDLSSNCEKCKAINIKIDAAVCPECGTEFKYLSFRNIRSHWPKLPKILEARPHVLFVDFEDYTRILGGLKAKEFFK